MNKLENNQFLQQVEIELINDEEVKTLAKLSFEDFCKGIGEKDIFIRKVIERDDRNKKLLKKIVDNPFFREDASNIIRQSVYNKIINA